MDHTLPDTPLFADVRQAYEDYTIQRKEDEKRGEHDTRLDVYHQTDAKIMTPMWYCVTQIASKAQDIPKRGSHAYTLWLDELWKSEPILAGAVYSMVAKMQSLTWKIEGGRYNANQVAEMLARARYMWGYDWAGFIGTSAIDFYTQDNGVYWDTIRSKEWGRLTDLAHIDTRNCLQTGNVNRPMYYRSSITNDEHYYKPDEYIHFGSMPLPSERDFGMGLCAVSRAARAARLLMSLHDYDTEKLSNLPPEGVAAVTGLTDREFRQAIALWKAEREKNQSLTFPQVLWLIGSSPGAKVSVDLTSFSSLPESWDRETVITQYVNTLAMCFGVDAREFWAMSTAALGTAAEAEVQHLKARGKGGGEFITMVEAAINAEIPDNVTFAFDTQDIEEDLISANIAAAWINAYFKLYFPGVQAGVPVEGVIDAQTFKRLLSDKGVLPEWAVGDERIAVQAHQVHKEEYEDLVRFIWYAGKISESKIAHLSMRLGESASAARRLKQAEILPALEAGQEIEDDAPIIRGVPIAESEVERGTRVTRKAVESALAMWTEIPELAAYAPAES